MDPDQDQNIREQDFRSSQGAPLGPFLGSHPLTTSLQPSHQPSRNPPDGHQFQAGSNLLQQNVHHPSYEAIGAEAEHHRATLGQPTDSTLFPLDATITPQDIWIRSSNEIPRPSSSYEDFGQLGDRGPDSLYHYEQGPQEFPPNLPEPTRASWGPEDSRAGPSRRSTITQSTHNAAASFPPGYPYPTPSGGLHHSHRVRGSQRPLGPERSHPRQAQGDDLGWRNNPVDHHGSSAYEQGVNTGQSSGRSPLVPHLPDNFQQTHGTPGYIHGFQYMPSAIPESHATLSNQDSVGIPQAVPHDAILHSSRTRRTQSPRHELASDHSGSAAATPAPATPAPTEGSADPAESDLEEIDSGASAPTSPVSPASPGSITSRWASFQFPPDIFMNPSDPARHELYHRIRHEDWFVNQTRERSITGREASRIPGSVPGDSVLLAFFKKVKDSKDKPAMHCTICLQTRGASKFYSRPDRAKVHIRHHFELRPVPCDRRCGITLCVQRFFTKADLEAHVAGRTEAPVPCEYCQKPLLAKNRNRHIAKYCRRVPEEILRQRSEHSGDP